MEYEVYNKCLKVIFEIDKNFMQYGNTLPFEVYGVVPMPEEKQVLLNNKLKGLFFNLDNLRRELLLELEYLYLELDANKFQKYCDLLNNKFKDSLYRYQIWLSMEYQEIEKIISKSSEIPEIFNHNIYEKNIVPEDFILKYFQLFSFLVKNEDDKYLTKNHLMMFYTGILLQFQDKTNKKIQELLVDHKGEDAAEIKEEKMEIKGFNNQYEMVLFFYYSGIYDAIKMQFSAVLPTAKVICKILGLQEEKAESLRPLFSVAGLYDKNNVNSKKLFQLTAINNTIDLLESLKLNSLPLRQIRDTIKH